MLIRRTRTVSDTWSHFYARLIFLPGKALRKKELKKACSLSLEGNYYIDSASTVEQNREAEEP